MGQVLGKFKKLNKSFTKQDRLKSKDRAKIRNKVDKISLIKLL